MTKELATWTATVAILALCIILLLRLALGVNDVVAGFVGGLLGGLLGWLVVRARRGTGWPRRQ